MMEIMIVVVIIGLMFSLSVPMLKGMNEGNKLRSAAREMVALMKYARQEAITNGRTTNLFVDTEKQEYWVDLRTPDEKSGEYNAKAKKSSLEQKRKFPQGVWCAEVNAHDENLVKDKILAVDFFEDGSASPALITLRNRAEKETTLEVLKSTGLTEVTPGSIADKEEKKQEVLAGLPSTPRSRVGAKTRQSSRKMAQGGAPKVRSRGGARR